MSIDTSAATAAPPSAAAAEPPGRYRRLLLPFDDSPASRHALDEALKLARESGASIELFAMFEATRHVSGFEPAHYAIDEVLPRARARLADVLEAARRGAPAAGGEGAAPPGAGGAPHHPPTGGPPRRGNPGGPLVGGTPARPR
ncbi:MAG: universal stress protein, partial [Burkholderiaceae bacterium]